MKIWIRFVKLCNISDLKSAAGVVTWDFAKNGDVAKLKSNVHLDIDKLKSFCWFE